MIQSKSITLNPGQSQVVNFEVTPSIAKTYQVTVDGLQGSFEAHAHAPEPHISGGLIVAILGPGELYAKLFVHNTGDASGTYQIKWYVNGSLEQTNSGTLAPGASAWPTLAGGLYPIEPGTYTIKCVLTWDGQEDIYQKTVSG